MEDATKKIRVKLDCGITVTGVPVGKYFAVTPHIAEGPIQVRNKYAITHVPSGSKIMGAMKSKPMAMALAKAIAAVDAPWHLADGDEIQREYEKAAVTQ